MTDTELNYQGMALNVLKLLRDARPSWEKVYAKLLPDFTALEAALTSLDSKTQQLTSSSKGYTEAKDLAEIAVLDAVMPVVQGLKALYQDGTHPALGKVVSYTRTALDALRGLTQVATLESIYEVAHPLTTELVEELVSAEQLELLRARTAAYKQLIGTPRQQISNGSVLREATVLHLAEARTALGRLDVRVPNLQAALPELVAQYQQARFLVNAGRGRKASAAPPVG